MTPSARLQAAIEVLDEIGRGAVSEVALTRWSRRSKFAGSKDRQAVRDHVFDVIRCKRSSIAFGGGTTGREMMIGFLRQTGGNFEELFGVSTYGAPALSDAEKAVITSDIELTKADQFDVPDWILPLLQNSLGNDTTAVLQLFKKRAPVFLRVNAAMKADPDQVVTQLVDSGYQAERHSLSPGAIVVHGNPRGLRAHPLFLSGKVELQDAASQALVDALEITTDDNILDYCAGGGGKSLAMAARGAKVTASDIDANRMRDIPLRAERGNVRIRVVENKDAAAFGPYDVVLCDAPCSGTGAWRRQPDAKWRLTQSRLDELNGIQRDILDRAAALVSPKGTLAYATCSILECENENVIQGFITDNPDWAVLKSVNISPLQGGDGFFLSTLTRGSLGA